MNNKGKYIKIIIIIIMSIILCIVGKNLFYRLKNNDTISGIKKALINKYIDIRCIDTSCNSFISIKETNDYEYKVSLYNYDSEKLTSYKTNDKNKIPSFITNKYYILKENDKYLVKNLNNKKIYESNKELDSINSELILENKKIIINIDQKKIYDSIDQINTYLDGKYIEIRKDNNEYILDKKGNILLTNYKISKILKDESNKEYALIVKKDNIYDYYLINKKKLINYSFSTYQYENNELIVSKDNKSYKINKYGKQKEIFSKENELTQLKSKYKDYHIYSKSIYDKKQKYIVVDNKKDNTFGILNTKNDEYNKLYDYKNKEHLNSIVSILKNNDTKDMYLKMSCLNNNCNNSISIIYNLTKNKLVYKSNNNILNYNQYDNEYKVIQFLNQDGYILLDKYNNEIYKSEDYIVLADKKLLIGDISNKRVYLYSTIKNDLLKQNPLYYENINENIVYKYEIDNDIVILNQEGNEVIKTNKKSYLELINDNYIYIDDNYIKIYNVKHDKTYKYKLNENDIVNKISEVRINPYKDMIFINNEKENYVKVINFKGDLLKKINNSTLSSIIYNFEKERVYIFVRDKTDKINKYGLYIAK